MSTMKIRFLLAVVSACLLILTFACDGNGRTYDPSQILDPAGDSSASDGMLLVDNFDQDPGLATDGDDDDDDGHCNSSDSDEPDEYDDEMFPAGDGDDDDDDDC